VIKLNIVAVGKLKEKYWREAVEEYAKRLQKYASFTVTEVEDLPDDGRQLDEEGKKILKKIKGFTVLLDIEGKALSSEEIASLIADKSVGGVSEFTFVIGGSRGVSAEVKSKADIAISFGKVTYPHQLMRVMLAEQLYRALTIINGAGYHK
jgi:23S rRNA (pseudouridine1915-N3)-methyltransferase